jgi:hypothetical protein
MPLTLSENRAENLVRLPTPKALQCPPVGEYIEFGKIQQELIE